MLYVISGVDSPGSLAGRRASRSAHLARITALRDEGRLVLAGPHPAVDAADPGEAGFTGSLVIAEFGSLEEAEGWAQDDPYLQSGVWISASVKPFVQVMP